MKKRINTIKNKILVEGGGENLLKDNEILVQNSNGKISLKERTSTGVKEIVGSGSDSEEEDCYYLRTALEVEYGEWVSLNQYMIIGSGLLKSCIVRYADEDRGILLKDGYVLIGGGSGFAGVFDEPGIIYVAIKKQATLIMEDPYSKTLNRYSSDFLELAEEFELVYGDISHLLISKEEYYSKVKVSFEDIPEGEWPPQ